MDGGPESTGIGASIAIDSAGNPAIAHLVLAGNDLDLRLARWDGAAWAIEVVDAGDVDRAPARHGPWRR